MKTVTRINMPCVYSDSVLEYYVGEDNIANITTNIIWKRKDTIDNDILFIDDYVKINYISDSILMYSNLMQINIDAATILPVFPKGIHKLKSLSGILNWGLVSDKTYEKVPKLDSLMGIELGIVTDSLTKIPRLLSSKILSEVTIHYYGENEKIIFNIIKKLLDKRSIKSVSILSLYEIKFSESMLKELMILKSKYKKKNKELIFYY